MVKLHYLDNMHTPRPISELKKMRPELRNIAIVENEKLRAHEHFAVWITQHIGTIGFFLIILFWTVGWFTWNLYMPLEFRFDPYPAFVLWLFISNMIQLCLMPLIMIGQNLQGRHSEARAQADFEINLKAEREIETILEHLENQNELILKITERLDKSQS